MGWTSVQARLEERIGRLEHDVAELKEKLDVKQQPSSWVDELSGTFEGDEGFREILRLGKELRDTEGDESDA